MQDIITHIPTWIFTSVADRIHQTGVHLHEKCTANNSVRPQNIKCFIAALKTILALSPFVPGTSSVVEQGQGLFLLLLCPTNQDSEHLQHPFESELSVLNKSAN